MPLPLTAKSRFFETILWISMGHFYFYTPFLSFFPKQYCPSQGSKHSDSAAKPPMQWRRRKVAAKVDKVPKATQMEAHTTRTSIQYVALSKLSGVAADGPKGPKTDVSFADAKKDAWKSVGHPVLVGCWVCLAIGFGLCRGAEPATFFRVKQIHVNLHCTDLIRTAFCGDLVTRCH